MIVPRVLNELESRLTTASDVWVAVALMKDEAFQKLYQLIPRTAKQSYLVGIDLPTEPKVLRSLKALQSNNFRVGIFQTSKTFHPKVYLIKTGGKLAAFVGSANLTKGGLSDNIEMNLFTDDQEDCQSLLGWFDKLYTIAFPLSEENLSNYEGGFKKIEEAEKGVRQIKAAIKLKRSEAQGGDPLASIDFSSRYFKHEHHFAFRQALWENRSAEANKERRKTYDHFYDLHEDIFPKFGKFGLSELDHHKVDRFIVSHYDHVDGFTSQQLSAMWLSYGKGKKVIEKYQELFPAESKKDRDSERDSQSFINHARLQIIIHYDNIGIWLFFGKKNGGSKFDRAHFKKEMEKESYRNKFFGLFKSLPPEYFISLEDNDEYHSDYFRDSDSLYRYCKQDNTKNHFVIGRNYDIEVDELSQTKLPQTVLTEFKRLLPFYDTMRDKQFG